MRIFQQQVPHRLVARLILHSVHHYLRHLLSHLHGHHVAGEKKSKTIETESDDQISGCSPSQQCR